MKEKDNAEKEMTESSSSEISRNICILSEGEKTNKRGLDILTA